MYSIRTPFYLLFALVFYACGATKNGHNSDGSGSDGKGNESDTQHQVIFEDLAEGDSLFASIRKGYCYGRCPVYELEIYNSGFVHYNGIANMELLGEHTSRLSTDQMLAFLDKANEISYFELNDEYDNPGISDLPETTTSLVMGGKRKSVRRRHGYPNSIIAFEDQFNGLLTSLTWNPGPERQ